MTSTAYILFNNVFLRAVPNASLVLAGSSARNAVDYRTTTAWRFNPADGGNINYAVNVGYGVQADCIALTRHNLAGICNSIKVQHKSGAVWLTDATITELNSTIFVRFNAATSSEWRLVFDMHATASTAYVAVIMLGQSQRLPFGMPMGFLPARHGRKVERISNITDAGQFAGMSVVRTGFETVINQQVLPVDWLRTVGDAWIKHAEIKPFFISPQSVLHADDAVYCWASNITVGGQTNKKHQSLTMAIKAI